MFLPRTVLAAALLLACAPPSFALRHLLSDEAVTAIDLPEIRNRQTERMVDVSKACRGVFIELRYATARNVTGRPIYPANARCLVRARVADQLKEAQAWLAKRGYALKIWDAYRPRDAHQALWDAVKNGEVVSDPAMGGSFHTFGVAVDATLVTSDGRPCKMPTDFDSFSPAAAKIYRGNDIEITRNLSMLQAAMAFAGFYGIRDEWWHFVSRNYRDYYFADLPLDKDPPFTTPLPPKKPDR